LIGFEALAAGSSVDDVGDSDDTTTGTDETDPHTDDPDNAKTARGPAARHVEGYHRAEVERLAGRWLTDGRDVRAGRTGASKPQRTEQLARHRQS
jgi:hypothetical protein